MAAGRSAAEQVLEPFVELGHLAARINEPLVAAGPRRMGLRINIELQHIAWFTPGRAGLIFGPIGHYHGNVMVIRVGIFLHNNAPTKVAYI